MSGRIRSWLMLCAAVLFLGGFDLFSTSNANVEAGNALLQGGKAKEAAARYEQAAKELPDEPGVHYNLGIALYQLGQFDKARQAMLRATAVQEPDLKARSFYNLGNAQYETKQYKEAVSAYQRALRLQPGHRASKWNLELALKRLQEEEKKKKEEEKKNQDKQKKDQKQSQDQQKKPGENQQQKDQPQPQDNKSKDKPQPPGKKQQAKDQPKQEKQSEPRNKPMQQQMKNVLDTLDQNDKNLQRQRARMMMEQGLHRPDKDW